MLAKFLLLLAVLALRSAAAESKPLPGTEPLLESGDPVARMLDGMERDLDRRSEEARGRRLDSWVEGTSESSLRLFLAQVLGAAEPRKPARLRRITASPRATGSDSTAVARGPTYTIHRVEWDVFGGIVAEGLLVEPDGVATANLLALTDSDTSPEQALGLDPGFPKEQQFVRRLAEAGCRVLVPAWVDRGRLFAGNPDYRTVDQSQRETLWRAGYEVGLHPLGMEVQMVLGGADAFLSIPGTSTNRLGVIGHGEGGLLALLAGALDIRFASVASSGAFGLGQRGADLPIERDIWSFSTRLGDAELAALIQPRSLLVEYGLYPVHRRTDKGGGAPGALDRPTPEEFHRERERFSTRFPDSTVRWVESDPTSLFPTSTLDSFLGSLGTAFTSPSPVPAAPAWNVATDRDTTNRTRRIYQRMLAETQSRMHASAHRRERLWKNVDRSGEAAFLRSVEPLRNRFNQEVLGVLPPPSLPARPKSRLLYETNGIRGYEVVLQVHPDVFATGILVLPAGLKPDDRRPVVVCQHGLEGRPGDLADPAVESPFYHRYAYRLAERGYVTFSPQNPYTGGTRFRQVLRRARPLGLTLWSYIVRQHEVITGWLADQPFVDPRRIAFYGLSYGGKTAMRVPAVVPRYCLSICSADYNEWILKNVSADSPYSYLWTVEYDMPEWNLADTFNYAEMSWLIFPRPFMVERGHDDGVAPDEWVAHEYARTRRHYVKLGRADRTEIEFFDGPHSIHGVGTFDFLDRHLGMPGR